MVVLVYSTFGSVVQTGYLQLLGMTSFGQHLDTQVADHTNSVISKSLQCDNFLRGSQRCLFG